MSQISTLIKRLRAAPVRLSQSEISRKTGIPQSRMSHWEAGRVPAGIDDAFKLVAFAESMGVQIPDASADPMLDARMTDAVKASQIERHTLVRHADYRAMLAAMKG